MLDSFLADSQQVLGRPLVLFLLVMWACNAHNCTEFAKPAHAGVFKDQTAAAWWSSVVYWRPSSTAAYPEMPPLAR